MSKSKRYTLELDTYLYARNDKEAKVIAAKFLEFLNKNIDTISDAKSISLHETPFASFNCREVCKGNLMLFENKLIAS